METGYKKIIQAAAATKLTDLTKEFLSILDEIKAESDFERDRIKALLSAHMEENVVDIIVSLILVVSDSKKASARKRILDKYNTLKRELQ